MSEDRRLFIASRGLLDAYLASRGMRRTPERYAVLTCIGEIGRKLFTTQELEAKIDAGELNVSRATLYNALSTFSEAGLIEPCGGSGSRRSYRLSPGGEKAEARCQLLCTECGKVKDVRDVTLVRLMMQARYPGFTPESGLMTINGLCSECNRKIMRERAKAARKAAREEKKRGERKEETSESEGATSASSQSAKKITKGKTKK